MDNKSYNQAIQDVVDFLNNKADQQESFGMAKNAAQTRFEAEDIKAALWKDEAND